MPKTGRLLPEESEEGVPGFVDPEKRTVRQELEALGVTIEPLRRQPPGQPPRTASPPQPQLTDIVWIERQVALARKIRDYIGISKNMISIGAVPAGEIAKEEGGVIKTLIFAVAKFGSLPVMLLKVNKPDGYMVKRSSTAGTISVSNKTVVEKLIKNGLKHGLYRLWRKDKANDAWIIVPHGMEEYR